MKRLRQIWNYLIETQQIASDLQSKSMFGKG